MTQTKPHDTDKPIELMGNFSPDAPNPPIEEKKHLDPVCGMSVSKNPEKMARHQGTSYYFCSQSCVTKFNAAPEDYVKAKKLIMPLVSGAPQEKAETSCCGGGHGTKINDSGLKDPVCGMSVTADSKHHFAYLGQTYYFCAASCLAKFSKDPDIYLDPSKRPAPIAAAKDAIFTCPMHPEVEQVGPGTCPKCGMALEPKEASAEEDTSELDDMTRRFKFSVVLSLPLLLMTMADMLPGVRLHDVFGMIIFNWLQFVLATPVVL